MWGAPPPPHPHALCAEGCGGDRGPPGGGAERGPRGSDADGAVQLACVVAGAVGVPDGLGAAQEEEDLRETGARLMGFGRHRQRTFEWTHRNAPGYVRWGRSCTDRDGTLAEFIDYCDAADAVDQSGRE